MNYRYLAASGAVAGALLVASAASAAPGIATGNVNMRTGPGTQYSVITTIPAGAPIEVFGCQGWCQVGYAGTQGYVSANYVSSGGGYVQPAPRAYYRAGPPVYYQPAPSIYFGFGTNRHRWYNDGDWRWRNGYRDRYRDRDWDRDRYLGSGAGMQFSF